MWARQEGRACPRLRAWASEPGPELEAQHLEEAAWVAGFSELQNSPLRHEPGVMGWGWCSSDPGQHHPLVNVSSVLILFQGPGPSEPTFLQRQNPHRRKQGHPGRGGGGVVVQKGSVTSEDSAGRLTGKAHWSQFQVTVRLRRG